MADTLFTRALARWMAGCAQMPLRAFHHLVDLLVAHERRAGAAGRATPQAAEAVTFDIGDIRARCPRCEAVEFLARVPA